MKAWPLIAVAFLAAQGALAQSTPTPFGMQRPAPAPAAPPARLPAPADLTAPFDMGGPKPPPPAMAPPPPVVAVPPPPPTVNAYPPPINAFPPPVNAFPPSTGTVPVAPLRGFERAGPSAVTAVPLKPAPPPQIERVAAAAAAPPPGSRAILPLEKLRLEGEIDGRSWAVFLTQEEAAAAATLTIAYTNSVVVMPEASRLRVSLNGEVVFDAPISSPGAVATAAVPVRRNLLRPGANRIRVEVAQRHRTDCTVDATYELWTELDGARTALTFAGVSDIRLRTLDDLPAVGHAVNGTTTLVVVAPGPPGAQVADRLLRAVQAVAIRGRFQHLVVKVGEAPQAAGPGALTFVIGTANELRDRVDGLPGEAATRPWIGFAVDRRLGTAVLVASGPSQAEVESAVEALAGPTERPAGVPRTEVDTITWRAPDAPLIIGERSVRLSNFDIATQEFSGRRFRTEFSIALPADFYAEFYGEAVLYLDAAYAQMVKPGSHFDVFVNGRITATLALNGARGGIFQRFPLKLLLRNFKAGVNDVVIESVLLTDTDAQCPPGGTLSGPNRFVLFDTTELKFPEYGRVGRMPDLGALSASGFPYFIGQNPVALILGRHDAPHYAAAATLVAKLAHSAGRPLRVDTSAQFLSIGDRRAIFIGLAGELPPSILPSIGIANTARTAWPNSVEAPTATPADGQPYDAIVDRFRERQSGQVEDLVPASGTEEIRDRWRKSLGGGALRREFTSFEDWMKRTFDVSFASFSPFSEEQEPFQPLPQTSIMLAQGLNPQGGDSLWTVAVGRNEGALADGMAAIVNLPIWRSLAGQLAAYQVQQQRLDQRNPTSVVFVETRPFSVTNTRQVLANWLSANMIFYAAALLGLCTILGLATSMMLKGLGRK